jgi:hypothetical protein
MSGATDRVREYLESRGITKYAFYKTTGFSNKFLDNSSNMGTDRAEIILRHYPDISPEWLIMGVGPMLRGEQSTVPAMVPVPPPNPVIVHERHPDDVAEIKHLKELLAARTDAYEACKEASAVKDGRLSDKDEIIRECRASNADKDRIIEDCRKDNKRLESENTRLRFDPQARNTSGLPFDVGLGGAPVEEL